MPLKDLRLLEGIFEVSLTTARLTISLSGKHDSAPVLVRLDDGTLREISFVSTATVRSGSVIESVHGVVSTVLNLKKSSPHIAVVR